MDMKPAVLQVKLLGMQVCVPKDWDDIQIEAFANREVLCGTRNGWRVKKQEDYGDIPATEAGAPKERVPCADREGFEHIVLEC